MYKSYAGVGVICSLIWCLIDHTGNVHLINLGLKPLGKSQVAQPKAAAKTSEQHRYAHDSG